MQKNSSVIIITFSFCFMVGWLGIISPVIAQETLLQSNDTGASNVYLSSGTQFLIITYGKTNTNWNLTQLTLKMYRTNNPIGFMSIRVFITGFRAIDSSGNNYTRTPSQTINYLYESNAIDCSTISNMAYTYYNFSFTQNIFYQNCSYSFMVFYKNFTTIDGSNNISFQWSTGNFNSVSMVIYNGGVMENRIYSYMLNCKFFGYILTNPYQYTEQDIINANQTGYELGLTQGSGSGYTESDLEDYFLVGGVLGVVCIGSVFLVIYDKRRKR